METETPPSPEQKKINTISRGVLIWGVVVFAFCLGAAIYSVVSQLRGGDHITPVPFGAPSASAFVISSASSSASAP